MYFQHFKGGIYEYLEHYLDGAGVAQVSYVCQVPGPTGKIGEMYIRPASEFFGPKEVGSSVLRFKAIPLSHVFDMLNNALMDKS
jgi:hypothetical protein